jgi:hypothetical protein
LRGPERRLKVKVSVRDLPFFRDLAVIMIDQLKEVYIDDELEMIDTANWLPKVMHQGGRQRHGRRLFGESRRDLRQSRPNRRHRAHALGQLSAPPFYSTT